MKKLYIVLGIAAVALMNAACNKETSPVEQKSETITIRASMPDDDEVDTKIALDLGTKAVTWEAGDKIKVISPNNWAFTDFTLEDGAGTKTASFTGTRDFGEATKMAALYGANFQKVGTPGKNSTYVYNIFPNTQSYASGPKAYLHFKTNVTSLTNLSNLSFKAMECIVKIPVKGAGVTLSSIRLDCNGVALAGRWYGLSCDSGSAPDYNFGSGINWSPAFDNASGYPSTYGNNVTLTGINESLTDEPKFFYIVVANAQAGYGTTNHGRITVTLTPTEGTPVVKEFANLTSRAGYIYKFPEVDMTE